MGGHNRQIEKQSGRQADRQRKMLARTRARTHTHTHTHAREIKKSKITNNDKMTPR